MTKTEIKKKLITLQKNGGDIEQNHQEADKILCDFLIEIGYSDIVKEYNKIEKWYA